MNEVYNKGWEEGQKNVGQKLSEIINQDGDEVSDGECIDQIIEYLQSQNIYNERE